MKKIEKGMTVKVVNEDTRDDVNLGALLEGSPKPSLIGEVAFVNPNIDDFVVLNEDFAEAVELGLVESDEDLLHTLIYFDAGANRYFIVPTKDVEVIEYV